jgi:CubicO group peptidase (beta-lactamase class C family)
MREAMAGHVERGEVPGLVTGVSRPVERDTIFRIASMTKPVTAAAVMILVEEGVLRLDEPVDGLLPELSGRRVLQRLDGPLDIDNTVPAHRPLTVRDLLTFTLGYGIVFAPPGTYPVQVAMDDLLLGQGAPAPATPAAPDDWIRRLGTLPLLHQPGERWMCHTGSDVAGVLIARASDQPFETFLQERIFALLGMRDTGFSVSAAQVDGLATSYRPDPGTGGLEVYDPPAGGQWSRLGQPRLGVRPGRRHPPPGLLGSGGPLRLGRRPGHIVGQRPLRGPGRRHPHPADVELREPPGRVLRLLDAGLRRH